MADESRMRVWTVGEKTFVSDEDGKEYELLGYGSMKHFDLGIDPRLDLTKPIYDQVQKLAAKDRAASRRATKKAESVAA